MAAAVQELKQIPFGHLIGSPLKAAIESQALAAQSTIDFIKQLGFKKADGDNDDFMFENLDADADAGEIRNVTFRYSKKDTGEETDDATENTESEFVLTVPILTITPIPYIRIDEMTIDFKAKLTDSVVHKSASATAVSASVSGKYGAFWSPVKVNFRVSATHKSANSRQSSQTREYQMDIHVRAVQDELPQGLSRILDILEDAISNDKS
mgnify:FL=1